MWCRKNFTTAASTNQSILEGQAMVDGNWTTLPIDQEVLSGPVNVASNDVK
jgi:hypothetical protein